jgi:CBS domain-containing protein/sporulation protein YlmC with PRC-barrel domain
MTSRTTFYLSQVLGKKVLSPEGRILGRIKDLLLEVITSARKDSEPVRPKVIAAKINVNRVDRIYDFSSFEIRKEQGSLRIRCTDVEEIRMDYLSNVLWLRGSVIDKQIVDINGKKLVRVRDVRMVEIPSGTYALAVDVGIEGWFRRMGMEKLLIRFLDRMNIHLPDKLILWDDIETVDADHSSIHLSKPNTKLNTLHPSDLADIIEDLDKGTRTVIFAALDEEQAADVLEELEPEAQVHIVESLPKEKVADVLEKMPADEVADILDELRDDKAEELLNEMEKESSEEVRELLEYPDKVVGSIMTTDFMTFRENMTVDETLKALRKEKPEPSYIYSIFVVDKKDRLLSAIPLGELVIAEPQMTLKEIMDKDPITVFDDDDIDILAELVSKYDLMAVPVINKGNELEGVVVVEDIVDDLLRYRKTK